MCVSAIVILNPTEKYTIHFKNKIEMPDLHSVTLVGGSPWGLRISGGMDFNKPLVIRYLVAHVEIRKFTYVYIYIYITFIYLFSVAWLKVEKVISQVF